MLRHINYIEIMILAMHRYSGRPILVRQLMDPLTGAVLLL